MYIQINIDRDLHKWFTWNSMIESNNIKNINKVALTLIKIGFLFKLYTFGLILKI